MEVSLAAETIGHIGSLPITNSMATSWIAAIILIVGAYFGGRNLKKIPKGIQNVAELIVEMLFGLIDSVFLDRKKTAKYFPYLMTIFLFIVTNNWLGLVPGVGSIGFTEHGLFVPIFRAGNADVNTTMALAILTVFVIQIFGSAALGVGKYASKFFNFKNPILFFVGILELISELSRIISFSFRLFGNVFAGEVLLTMITSLLPYVGPVPFYFLEVLVGLIQALVFTILATVFVSLAIEDHSEHEAEHEPVPVPAS